MSLRGFLKKVYNCLKTNRVMKERSGVLGNRFGQVTIFIIIGIIFVSSVGLFFALRTGIIGDFGIGGQGEKSVNSFLNTCLEEKVKEASKKLSLGGGYFENSLNINFKFSNEDDAQEISYLCYNKNDYLSCVNQEPLLFKHLNREIKNYVSEEVEICFDKMLESFKNEGFEVSGNYGGFDVELKPREIVLQTDSEVTLTKSDETTTQKNFEVLVSSRLYELTKVVQEAVNKESSICDFNYLAYTLLYPEFDINTFRTNDLSKIYTIEHEESDEKFIFAVRGCVLPLDI